MITTALEMPSKTGWIIMTYLPLTFLWAEFWALHTCRSVTMLSFPNYQTMIRIPISSPIRHQVSVPASGLIVRIVIVMSVSLLLVVTSFATYVSLSQTRMAKASPTSMCSLSR